MTEKVENGAQLPDTNEDPPQPVEEIFAMMNKYEEMILEIQSESTQFKEETKFLKENLAAIIEENNRLRESPEKSSDFAAFKYEYIDVGDKIFSNLRNQIHLANQEKELYENLWMKTAHVLQREVPIDSMEKIKLEHGTEIKILKNEIEHLKSSTDKATKTSAAQQNHLRLLTEEAKKLILTNHELKENLKKLEAENKDLHDQIQEFEKCFAESNELNREQMEKASKTFQKLQESVAVADEAMAEVERLVTEKKQMEEECNWLSTNITSIIEKASHKIDKDMDEIKVRHEKELDKLNQLLELEKEKLKTSEMKTKGLEEKVESLRKENYLLVKDLYSATETIGEIEKRFNEMKKDLQKSIFNESVAEEVSKLMKIIENNQKSKQKWKKLIFDVTSKLEAKVKSLIEENQKLKMMHKKSHR